MLGMKFYNRKTVMRTLHLLVLFSFVLSVLLVAPAVHAKSPDHAKGQQKKQSQAQPPQSNKAPKSEDHPSNSHPPQSHSNNGKSKGKTDTPPPAADPSTPSTTEGNSPKDAGSSSNNNGDSSSPQTADSIHVIYGLKTVNQSITRPSSGTQTSIPSRAKLVRGIAPEDQFSIPAALPQSVAYDPIMAIVSVSLAVLWLVNKRLSRNQSRLAHVRSLRSKPA